MQNNDKKVFIPIPLFLALKLEKIAALEVLTPEQMAEKILKEALEKNRC